MSTWKEASGREVGSDGYQFGDATSWVLGRIFKPKLEDTEDDADDNDDDDEKETRRIEALRKVEEIRRRRSIKKLDEESNMPERYLKKIVGDFLSAGNNISEEQLDQLWSVSRDISAEKAASVFSELFREQVPAAATLDNPEAEECFGKALDSLLSSRGITSEQLSDISAKAKLLSSATLVTVLQNQLKIHWEKKEAAKKAKVDALEASKKAFEYGIKRVVELKAITIEEFDLLCSISVVLDASVVNIILNESNTSWEKLSLLKQEGIKRQDEAAVKLMNSRPEKGFRPPPPPIDPVSGARVPPPKPPPPPPKVPSIVNVVTATAAPLRPPPPASSLLASTPLSSAPSASAPFAAAAASLATTSMDLPGKRPSFLSDITAFSRESLAKSGSSDFLTDGSQPLRRKSEDNSLAGILKSSLAAMRDKIKAAEELGDDDYDDDHEWNHSK